MNKLTQRIIENNLANRVIRVSQLKRLLGGTEQRRYNLVNRAIKKKELVRLQRGLYLLNNHLRDFPCHPFHLAQAFAPGSYISFETALAYHGWIPESVFITKSAVPGRKSKQPRWPLQNPPPVAGSKSPSDRMLRSKLFSQYLPFSLFFIPPYYFEVERAALQPL